MNRAFFLLIVSFMMVPLASAQSVNVPLEDDYLNKIERYRLLSGKVNDSFHPSFKPYMRSTAISYTESIDPSSLNDRDQFNLDFLSQDNWEYSSKEKQESAKSLFSAFYNSPSDLFHVDQEDFQLHINPVLYLEGGTESAGDEMNFVNTRGLEVRGLIDSKIGFYSFIGENQMRVPEYVDAYIIDRNVVPHEGFWKNFKGTGYDFFTARGYLSFQATKHVNIQFGYDRHKIGQGIRSLVLSDFAPPNLYARFQTNLWKFSYTNLITQLTENNVRLPTGRYPEKYMVLHHLSLNITKKINIGFFEAIMSGGKEYGGFQLSYLNPVIFYRAIEQQNGSTDNALVGMDAEWLAFKGVSFYGQFVLDEFLLSNIREKNGWWANKSGLQLGMNYVNFAGIENLDFKAEYNTVRPYTYSHYSTYGSHSNFRQSLAHPWGANFREVIVKVSYQPIDRMNLTAKLIRGSQGKDGADENWGGDPLKDYTTREMDFGNKTTQGVLSTLTYGSIKASYMLKHNLFIDGIYLYRKEDSADNTQDSNNSMFSFGIRLNVAARTHEF